MRDAHPALLPGHAAVVQLYPDADPSQDAATFAFWRIPGHKQLLHDGKGLALIARSPGHCLRFAFAPGLEDGMAVAYAQRSGTAAPAQSCAPRSTGAAKPRPTPTALLELHSLQALDATLAGASLREVAEGLFGRCRSRLVQRWRVAPKVRRAGTRGDALMRGGYRTAHAGEGSF